MNTNSRDYKLGFIAGKLDTWREDVNGELCDMLEYIYYILPNNIQLSQEEIMLLCGYGIGEHGTIMWYMGREPVITLAEEYAYREEQGDDENEIWVICRDSLGDKWISERVMIKNLHELEENE